MDSALAFYAQQSEITDPGPYASYYEGLPRNLAALHRIVQNLYLHVWKVRAVYPHLLEGRTHEIESRRVTTSLTLALARDDRPLTEERPLEKKLIVDCRHHAVLLCSLLRHQGRAARVRGGFATYLQDSHLQDHWVTEYWSASEARWILEDPDLVLHDIPRDQFVVAGAAWQAVRSGRVSAAHFGYSPDLRGEWAVRFNLIRDLASLNGLDGLTGERWGLIDKPEESITEADRSQLDEAAAWTLAGNHSFTAMQTFYASNPLFCAPRMLQSYNYVADVSRTINLDEAV